MYICRLMIVNFSRLDFQYITTNQIPMKRHNIIVFLFFLVFGTIEGGISAQPYIRWNAITWQSTKSLVQDWRTGNAIGYMEDPTGDGYFFLKGNGCATTTRCRAYCCCRMPSPQQCRAWRVLYFPTPLQVLPQDTLTFHIFRVQCWTGWM